MVLNKVEPSNRESAPPMLLAIESSTEALSVALLHGESVLAFEEVEGQRKHASALLPAIDSMLRQTGVSLAQLTAIGVATGPGSFTSLRIGLATVKGLALGREIPTVGVSTLEAMALFVLEEESPASDCEVVAILDARRSEWYAGGWSRPVEVGGLPISTLPEGLYGVGHLVADRSPHSILITPEGPDWRFEFEAAGIQLAEVFEGRAGRPRADWVGRLAGRRLALGEGIRASALEARYLRRAEAEAKRLGGPVEKGEMARLENS